MLAFIATVFFIAGCYIFSFVFRFGYKKVPSFLLGLALIAIGAYLMPPDATDKPEIEYRK